MVVPLTMPNKAGKMRLASPDYCQKRCAIKTSHLWGLPPNSADILAAVGCLCILAPQADCASPLADSDEPFTTALSAASAHLRTPLSELVSEKLRFNGSSFTDVRHFLAKYVDTAAAQKAKVWSVIKQCSIFEAVDSSDSNQLTHLSDHKDVRLLPNSAWEAHLADLNQLMPGKFTVYHTGTDTQRTLLRLSGAEPVELCKFISEMLLPATVAASNVKWEPLVLKALTDLASHPIEQIRVTKLFTGGDWHQVIRLVDSSTNAMKLLWSKSGDLRHFVLPPTLLHLAPTVSSPLITH